MIRKLAILAFVLSLGCDSLAAVTPLMDAEGCSAKCCQHARQSSPVGRISRLSCMMDCSEPGATNATSPIAWLTDEGKLGRVSSSPLANQNAAASLSTLRIIHSVDSAMNPTTV